jgi:hypothetical protein
MVMRRAWVLNFDAERELESPRAYRTPSRQLRARMAALEARVGPLVSGEDRVLVHGEPRGTASGWRGEAWCRTPRALERIQESGALVPPAPPFEVLRRVNHRGFRAALGQGLSGAAFVRDEPALARTIRAETPSGSWLLKRPFGFAGRARRKVRAGALSEADRAWALASLARGEGLQVEPWVERRGDFAQHGWLSRHGALVLGEPTVQVCDAAGAWLETSLAGPQDLSPAERSHLEAAVRTVGAALAGAGYFGPFGVDAFRYWDGAAPRFHACSEINARYSMGWAYGMGGRRTRLED